MDEPINTLPIAGWDIRVVPAMDAVIFTPAFIANAMQRPADAIADRNFILGRSQARDLAAALIRAAQRLETGGIPPAGNPTH